MTKWILVDTESGARQGAGFGQSPYTGVMTEFGAVELVSKLSFHGVLWPSQPSAENPAIPEILPGAQPYDSVKVMTEFAKWLDSLRADRLVFVSDNNGWDYMWISYEFDRAGIPNPFGHSSRRIGDFWAGLETNWRDSSLWKRYRVTAHTHHPVDDALGNAEALEHLLRASGLWEMVTE